MIKKCKPIQEEFEYICLNEYNTFKDINNFFEGCSVFIYKNGDLSVSEDGEKHTFKQGSYIVKNNSGIYLSYTEYDFYDKFDVNVEKDSVSNPSEDKETSEVIEDLWKHFCKDDYPGNYKNKSIKNLSKEMEELFKNFKVIL